MSKPLKKKLRFLVRLFWTCVFSCVILFAVCVQIGRALFPMLNDHRDWLAQQASSRINGEVEIGAIEAQWQGLRPQIALIDVRVVNEEQETIFTARKFDAHVGLLAPLYDWRVALQKVRFEGLQATFQQKESGQWTVQGWAGSEHVTDTEFAIDDPLDVFLFGRRVELRDTRLEFQFRTGRSSSVHMPRITLENDANFHRLTAVAFGEGRQSLRLVVEGHGNPREGSLFQASGYLQSQDFPLDRVFEAFGLGDQLPAVEGALDTQLWFNGTVQQGLAFSGGVATKGLRAGLPATAIQPESIRTKVVGRWHRSDGWNIGLRDLQMSWPDFSPPPLEGEVRGKLGDPISIAVNRIDLEPWHEVVQRSHLLPDLAEDIFQQLQPTGALEDLHITLTDAEHGYFDLRSNIRDAAVQPWHQAPALAGVEGYLNMNALSGRLVLDQTTEFVMAFPAIYRQPLEFEQASGELHWVVDTEQRSVGISSGRLRVANQDIEGTGWLDLRLPWRSSPGDEPEMTLVVGAGSSPALLHRRLVPSIVPEGIDHWLEESVRGGSLTDIGFIYHGTLLPQSSLSRTIQFNATVAQVELRFDSNWPALTHASAEVLLDNHNLTIERLNGRLAAVDIDDGQVRLVDDPDNAEGRALAIEGLFNASSGNALDLLRQSPVIEQIGSEVASWQMHGNVSGRVDLLVPLRKEPTGGRQDIAFELEQNRLFLPNLGLQFENIDGAVAFSSETGVLAEQLQGELWGQPISASLNTRDPMGQSQIELDFTGDLDVEHLQQWLGTGSWHLAEGVTAVEGALQIPLGADKKAVFRAVSDLNGVAVNLPQPFVKAPEESWPMDLEMDFELGTSFQRYQISLQEQGALQFMRNEGRLSGLTLALGKSSADVEEGAIRLEGTLPELDLGQWRQKADGWMAASREDEAETKRPFASTTGLPLKVDLTLAMLHLGPVALTDLAVQGEGTPQAFALQLNNANVSGDFRLQPDQPLQVDFRYLRLPETPLKPDTASPQPLDFAELPPLDVRVQQLSVGAEDFGRWSFKLRPINAGTIAYDLEGEIRGMTVTGKNQRGAELLWLQSAAGELSYFSGVASTGNVGDVLSAWGQTPVLTSRSASIDLDVQWPGSPVRWDLNELSGMVSLALNRGRFIRGVEVGENPLVKLIGLLNFDTLARRLRLDFSDLRPEGMAYEQVDGVLQFNQGLVTIDEPLRVETPSSDIQFAGEINTRQQTLDAQVVATLPLAGNLTMAAALMAGLPVAAGVYAVGKIFSKQVSRASSIRYRVGGQFDDPDIRVERIFEDRTNIRADRSAPADARSEDAPITEDPTQTPH